MPDFDTSRPNVARVYDYWLGGKENFAADRAQADKLAELFPGIRQLVRGNREFIIRAVSWVAGQGVSQFVDVGAGLPTSPNTHEAAQAVNHTAKVVYVDNDHCKLGCAHAGTPKRRETLSRGQTRDGQATFVDELHGSAAHSAPFVASLSAGRMAR